VLQSPADCEPWVFLTSPPPGDDRLAIVCHADVRQHNQTSIWFARERIEHAIDIVKVVSSSCSSAARPQPQPAARQASGSESAEPNLSAGDTRWALTDRVSRSETVRGAGYSIDMTSDDFIDLGMKSCDAVLNSGNDQWFPRRLCFCHRSGARLSRNVPHC
jgi:hypothetical protein